MDPVVVGESQAQGFVPGQVDGPVLGLCCPEVLYGAGDLFHSGVAAACFSRVPAGNQVWALKA